jgi:hypothetical protein
MEMKAMRLQLPVMGKGSAVRRAIWLIGVVGLLGALVPACRKAEESVIASRPPAPKAVRAEPALPEKAGRADRQPQAPRQALRAVAQDRRLREVGRAELTPAQDQALQRYHGPINDAEGRSRAEGMVTGFSVEESLQAYESAVDAASKVDALNQLAGRDEPQVLDLLRGVVAEGEPLSQIAALEALTELPRVEHLPVVKLALESTELEVRLAGLWLLSHIPSEAALPIWHEVIHHPSAEMVQFGFERLAGLPAHLLVPIAKQALMRSEPWVVEQALNLLGGVSTKAAVEALIPYVDHPVSGDLAQSGLFFLLSEHFDEAKKAAAWWQQQRDALGPDLQPKVLN